MGHPLHIAHGVLSLDVGGLERLVIGLVRNARRQGHRVSVVCIERPGRLAAEAEAAGAVVVSLDKPHGRHPEYVDRAASVLSDLRPDVIHTHQIGAAWFLGRAARRLGPPRAPVLHTEHGNVFAERSGWWPTLKARLIIHTAARAVDRYCCVSAEIASAIARWRTVPRAKVEVVPNGISTDRPCDLPPPEVVRRSLGIPATALVVGTVGRLAEIKQQDILVRAAGKLPGVRLLLVGDGPERPRLEALVGELKLSDRVHFAGYQPCPEQFLRAMDVFCLPSRSEGFPISLLEAWLAGVPAVCSAVGGIPDVVAQGETALLVPTGDVPALVDALSRLLDDRDLRGRLGQAGQQVVRERYTLERVTSEYEVRYRSLLTTRGGAARCAS
ncbi:MAG TPA: glycosyltransferase family 4 protein [Fimbriiglobus sp.]|nr:glycosyltransferase family 4 protein [Fimbriiglobus sp.]